MTDDEVFDRFGGCAARSHPRTLAPQDFVAFVVAAIGQRDQFAFSGGCFGSLGDAGQLVAVMSDLTAGLLSPKLSDRTVDVRARRWTTQASGSGLSKAVRCSERFRRVPYHEFKRA